MQFFRISSKSWICFNGKSTIADYSLQRFLKFKRSKFELYERKILLFSMVHGKTTDEWHKDDIRIIQMTYEYIRVTYEWHTSTYEWHTNNIRVHTSDIQMTYEYTRVTYEYIQMTYEYIKVTCKWHMSDIRMTCGSRGK